MNRFIKSIYPNLCIFCGESLQGDFCESCFSKFAAKPLSDEFITAALRYEDEVKNAIWRFKFRENFFAARQLSEYMKIAVLDKFCDVEIDFVSYVPQTKKKERRRGYNHGEILAKAVADKLSVECKPALIKVLETKDQHDLSFKDRVNNLDGAFKSVLDANGQNILLVDDVLTSGNTIKECVRVLSQIKDCNIYTVVATKA